MWVMWLSEEREGIHKLYNSQHVASLLFPSFFFKRQNNLGRNPVPAKVSGDLLIFPNKLETITSFFLPFSRWGGKRKNKRILSVTGGGERKQKEKGKKMESEQDKTSEKLRSARPRFPFYLV